MRFAVSGGREGWIRTALTTVGVGLGVAVLLLGASVPSLLDAWHGREKARENLGQAHPPRPADDTLLYASADTTFKGQWIRGRLVRPDGAHPPAPPGVKTLPGPGRMYVSPQLKSLLEAPGGKLLRERLPYRVVGTIQDSGLLGPRELTYLAGSDRLHKGDAYRIDHFGKNYSRPPLRPEIVLLVIMTCVALLTPVMVFIGTSVRLGGERREHRLAALRLVGADVRTTRRIAAGEALSGSLLGLLAGAGLFLGGRQLASVVTLWGVNVFPSDVLPAPGPAALVAVVVPALSVLVTLLAQRGVTVEPLGVVRDRPSVRRRLWWRLAVPAAGVALLLAAAGGHDRRDSPWTTTVVAVGAMLLLLGVTALLPWLVEAVVGRLRGGPVPWQLAVRRLQLSSGAATRAVSGITVAVAGAIAVHMLFTGMQGGFAAAYAKSGARPVLELRGHTGSWQEIPQALRLLRDTEGVREAHGTAIAMASRAGDRGRHDEGAGGRVVETVLITVGDCRELSQLAALGSCADGDIFLTDNLRGDPVARPGARLNLDPPEVYGPPGPERPWTLPASARFVAGKKTGSRGYVPHSILATPAALDVSRLREADMELSVTFDRAVPDVVERIRNTAARISPTLNEMSSVDNPHDQQYNGLRTGLFVGAVITLGLIGAGLVISTVEQLRERRRLLSVLNAFGTRHATLGWSILWQTAVPVVLGLSLALAVGLGLGALLLTITESGFVVDWPVVAGMTGLGAGVILLVTALSLPPLWRMMRPDGLRTE
ncbi:FtsX-like permease family protein [Streptomyces sp. MST-110588]|uniref:ABC transporter permease n=1 Tax=Streptomyces sp. MST-110588 TaxID=2833628 RepID=UPI001F5CE4CF|nr:FtsX-like permease family protein [Streptomyces sp. MST-110588]